MPQAGFSPGLKEDLKIEEEEKEEIIFQSQEEEKSSQGEKSLEDKSQGDKSREDRSHVVFQCQEEDSQALMFYPRN